MAVFTAQKAPESKVSSQLGQYWSQSMHRDLLPPENRFYLDLNPSPILLNSGTTINGCRSHHQQQWLLLKEKCWAIHWKYCYHAVQKDQWTACLMGGGKTKSNWASRYINIKYQKFWERCIFPSSKQENVSWGSSCDSAGGTVFSKPGQPAARKQEHQGSLYLFGSTSLLLLQLSTKSCAFQVYILFSPSRTAFKTSQ